VTGIAGPATATVDGGAALARALVASGVHDLFGVPAGKLAPFLRAVAREPRIRHLGTRHEASAAWMATATFHGTGRLAACYGEMGPGAHNLVGGLGTARANGLAVLVLTSLAPTHLGSAGQGLTMAADVARLMGATTKWTGVAASPEQIPALVRAAAVEAQAGRPGPVYLGLPADVLAADVELAASELDARPDRPPSATLSLTAVEQAARALADATRPLVVAGGGVVLENAVSELRSLARRLGAAATTTQMGLGAVSTAHPAFFGHGGLVGGAPVMRALREADVVLLAGCRVSSWLWEGSTPALGPPGQHVIHLDVDPTAAHGVLPSSTLVLDGGVMEGLTSLLAALGGGPPRADAAWIASLVADHRDHMARLFAGSDEAGAPLHPALVAREIGAWLPDEALVVYDGGHTTFWSNDLTPARAPRTRFHDPGMAHLGFGLPYAIALRAAHPGRPVVNVTGDGAFGFTLAELDTARRLGLPVVTVIHDNAAWGVIRFGQERAGFELDTTLEGTDYTAVARAFGGHGERVTELGDLRPALDRALASGLPAVVDVRTRFVPHPSLPLFAAMGR
jgi:thiamine pyrophosphate-dependent acetolactate synthase large subunit-like protein